MTLAIAIEKRLEPEIARVLEIMGHGRDRPEGLNEADTEAAFIDPIPRALGWSCEIRSRFTALLRPPPETQSRCVVAVCPLFAHRM